jgi:hypothetical protein
VRRHRGYICEHANPAEWINSLKLFEKVTGNVFSRNTMKSVATRNECTTDFLASPINGETYPRRLAFYVVKVYFVCAIKGGEP